MPAAGTPNSMACSPLSNSLAEAVATSGGALVLVDLGIVAAALVLVAVVPVLLVVVGVTAVSVLVVVGAVVPVVVLGVVAAALVLVAVMPVVGLGIVAAALVLVAVMPVVDLGIVAAALLLVVGGGVVPVRLVVDGVKALMFFLTSGSIASLPVQYAWEIGHSQHRDRRQWRAHCQRRPSCRTEVGLLIEAHGLWRGPAFVHV